ncbi:hypothetical protein U9M48_022036 [Paspalum notatum var. saurae]|uniref:Uncharacterized protein n=1 Tax=Paspalum notatum var. saurae TaxID=547442 RepID=A0AAQ3TKZ7_PASNO
MKIAGRDHLSGPVTMYMHPLDYKRGGMRNVEDRLKFTLTHSGRIQRRSHTIFFSSFTLKPIQEHSSSGRRVLRSGGPNHSKPLCLHRAFTTWLSTIAPPNYS